MDALPGVIDATGTAMTLRIDLGGVQIVRKAGKATAPSRGTVLLLGAKQKNRPPA